MNLAIILAFISWVEPTLLVVATELVPSPVWRGKVRMGEFWGLGNKIKFVQFAEPPSPAGRERGWGAGKKEVV